MAPDAGCSLEKSLMLVEESSLGTPVLRKVSHNLWNANSEVQSFGKIYVLLIFFPLQTSEVSAINISVSEPGGYKCRQSRDKRYTAYSL